MKRNRYGVPILAEANGWTLVAGAYGFVAYKEGEEGQVFDGNFAEALVWFDGVASAVSD